MTGWGQVLLRHLRISAARWAALALVVALAAAAAMAWPRWLESSATTELREDLGSAMFVDPVAVPSGLWLSWLSSAQTLPDAEQKIWGGVQHSLEEVRAQTPEPLRSHLQEPGMFQLRAPVATPDPAVTDVSAMSIEAFSAPDFLDRVEFVAGAAPTYTPVPSDWMFPPRPGEPGFDDLVLETVEIALSVEAAEEMRWQVGQTRWVTSDWGELPVQLAGTYRATAASQASGWADQAVALLRPTVSFSPDQDVLVSARAWLPPDASMMMLTASTEPAGTRLWFPLQSADLTAHDAAALAEQLRVLRTSPADLHDTGGLPIVSATFSSGAPEIIEAVLARQQATTAVLALAVAAPAGVLLVLLALAAGVIVQPRRTALHLIATRGLSPAQRRTLLGTEAALVSLPAAGLGALAASWLLPAYASPWWWAAPAVIGAAPVVALVTGTAPRPRPRLRLVAELSVALLAVAALVLLLTTGSQDGGRLDPLAVACPLLVAAAVALVCIRVLPALLRPLATRLAERPDLVPALGSRLAARRRPPLASTIAIVTGAAVAVLGQVTTATVSSGLGDAALTSVGADVRLTGQLPDDTLAAVTALPGVAAIAPVVQPTTSGAVVGAEQQATVTMYAVDPAALAAVQVGVPDAIEVPVAAPSAPAGLVVAAVTDLPVGTSGDLVLGQRLPVTIAATATRAPGLTDAGSWAVIDVAALRAAGIDLPASAALLALESDLGEQEQTALLSELRTLLGDRVTVTATSERTATLAQGASAQAMRIGLVIITLLGVGAAVAAVLLTLAGGAEARTRLVSVLRTLGLPPGAQLRLVLWEIAPAVGAALLLGAGLGLGLAALVVHLTDLRPFTGASTAPPLVIDPLGLTLTLVGVLVALTGAVLVAAWAAGRRSAAVVLRVGEGSS